MRSHQRSLVDWALVAVLSLALIAFFMFMSHRVSSGQVLGTAFDSAHSCYAFAQGLPVVVTYDSIILCPDTEQLVEYFVIQVPQVTIDCQGSLLKGDGGALLVPENVVKPRVTLKDCKTEGFGGLYSSQNPVDLYSSN